MAEDHALKRLWAAAEHAGLDVRYAPPDEAERRHGTGRYFSKKDLGESRQPRIRLYRGDCPRTGNNVPDLETEPDRFAAILAHEFGHFLSDSAGNFTEAYLRARDKVNTGDNTLTRREQALVRDEEQRAWVLGRRLLNESGIELGETYNQEERLGLDGYERNVIANSDEYASRLERLESLAGQVGTISVNERTVGVVGYMLGAIWSLRHALPHVPRAVLDNDEELEHYRGELTEVSLEVMAEQPGYQSAHDAPFRTWIAGHSFHGALHRIAALCERVAALAHGKRTINARGRDAFWTQEAPERVTVLLAICNQTNWLKHRLEGSMSVPVSSKSRDRLMTPKDALDALEAVVGVATRFCTEGC